jgi:Zn-dependent M28 family amino/carboxypeptidase
MRLAILYLFLLSIFYSCQDASQSTDNTVAAVIDSSDIEYYLSNLASDKFLGRRPMTEGETVTINFLKEEFEKMGLKPGNNGSYFQEVPIVEIIGEPDSLIQIETADTAFALKYKDDYVTYTERVREEVSLENSELVFCGFGIVAPEYGWNDYEGIDMTGKTAVVFVNDPGYYSEDSTLFKGKTMTYYGRWTYKYEEAARQGAAGILIIHETGAAGYPWFVIKNSWAAGVQCLQTPDGNMSRSTVQGWLTLSAASTLFEASDIEGTNMLDKAMNKDFKPMPLGIKYTHSIRNQLIKANSKNVVAILPGTTRSDEYIIYTAHWDHFGVGPEVDGDSIYNGAMDNASGTANMMAIAKTFASMETAPERNIVFLAVTAEEQGLLGSAWYAENPIYPVEKTIANMNIDGANYIGAMNDLTVTGYGQSDLDDMAREEAEKQGRYILPDQEPEKGYFFRSDHFNFAKVGIPALYAQGQYDHRTKGKDYAFAKADEYTKKNYHRPSDNFDPKTWQFAGAVQDAQLYYNIGLKLANSDLYPQWKEDSEFKKVRELKD